MRCPEKCGIVVLFLLLGSLLFASPVELTGGELKLILYPETGSFSLLHLSDIGKNRYEPLFEDRNFSTTSWFSVLSNGRIFRLSSKPGKPVVFSRTDTGAKFIFTLTDDFQVEQNFSFIKDKTTEIPYAVRIDTRIENTSGKTGTFALKALFDTMLGESEGIHFFTNTRNRISSETLIRPGIDPDSVIVSRNRSQSLMFLLGSSGASLPEYVFISNWERLNTLTWKPDFVEGRSFNTLYSVNDSALLFVWPERVVDANKTLSVSCVFGTYIPQNVRLLPVLPGTAALAGQMQKNGDGTRALSDKEILMQKLLQRISEIQANPDSASNEELRTLNQSLDALLNPKKE